MEGAGSDVGAEVCAEVSAIRQVEGLEENREAHALAHLELLTETRVQFVEDLPALAAECNLMARIARQACPQLRRGESLGAEQVVRIAIEHDRMRRALAAAEAIDIANAFHRRVRPRGSPLHDGGELDAPGKVHDSA